MTTDKLEQIRDALDDLAGFVNERYAGYQETDRRFARDFAIMTRAREALHSLEAVPHPVGAIPDGYVLVPKEPTPEMRQEAAREYLGAHCYGDAWIAAVYSAMISAAPPCALSNGLETK